MFTIGRMSLSGNQTAAAAEALVALALRGVQRPTPVVPAARGQSSPLSQKTARHQSPPPSQEAGPIVATPPQSPQKERRRACAPPAKDAVRKACKSRVIPRLHGRKTVPSWIMSKGGVPLSDERRRGHYRYNLAKRRAPSNRLAKGATMRLRIPDPEGTATGGKIAFWRLHYVHGALQKCQSDVTCDLKVRRSGAGEVEMEAEIPEDLFGKSRWPSGKCVRGPRMYIGAIQTQPSKATHLTLPYHTEITPTAKDPRFRDPVTDAYPDDVLFDMITQAKSMGQRRRK